MIKNTFPLLVENNEKIYRIINITMGNDNSFYFSFPNSTEYRLKTFNILQYSKESYSKKQIQPSAIDFDFKMPKVSFHPNSLTVHIKSQKTNNLLNKSYKLYNHNKNGYFECPFMQISLPYEMEYFEEYNKAKYPITYTLKRRNHRKNMSIYIFIHSSKITPPNVLNIKSKHPNILEKTMNIDNDYTLSFYVSCTERQRNGELVITINTVNCALISILEKIKI